MRQDPTLTKKATPVLQGEYKISGNADDVMVTVLGSCVATCLWDPVANVGGMNHFLLAGADEPRDGNLKYGVNSMELLINSLLRAGADRDRLQGKLFGGARMMLNSRQIGLENASFARWYLENEAIPLVSECLGGDRGRKIRFVPASGEAKRMFLGDPIEIDSKTMRKGPEQRATKKEAPATNNGVELF